MDDVFDMEPGEMLPDDARSFFLPVPASSLDDDLEEVEGWLEEFLEDRRLYELDVEMAGATNRYGVSITYAEEEGRSYGVEVLEQTYVPWEDVASTVLSFNEDVEAFMEEHEVYAAEHILSSREAGVEHLSAWIVYGE